jgi:diamine N-acetyltransferase
MQVRLATVNDAEFISTLNADVQELHAAALPHLFKLPSSETFPAWAVTELLNTLHHYFFIGQVNGEAIGYLYAEVRNLPENASRYATTHVYIHHISIKPRYQHRGYGEGLILAVGTLAHDKGITTMVLDVWSFNTHARAFFVKQGFAIFNERMWAELG